MGKNDLLWQWEIIYKSLKKPQTSQNFADPTHVKNGFIALYDRVVQLEEVVRRAELDVRVNLNPMLERMFMHPFTLLEKDLRKALGSE